jgi:REP-associated tyrosine transposase
MPRKPRVVAAGVPHHVTQRGNNRQDIFLVDEDRRFYWAALTANSRRHGLRVVGYCLRTNPVHLVVVPERPDSLRRSLQRTHSHYAQRFNRRYGRSGHLWQGRFYSCPLGRDHLVTAVAYVDLNPVRAHIVGRADHYPWSQRRGTPCRARPRRLDRYEDMA